jgi:predicted nuclease of predicted toxin-antitoxin system
VRFLADENCDFAVVRALRAAGHDILAVAELSPRSDDRAVIDLAVQDNRVLLTEDKDFGQLVYANSQPSGGIIFIRFPANTRQTLPTALLKLIQERGDRLTDSFVVLAPGRVRIGRNPSEL